MNTKQTIAIIGATGEMGSAIAASIAGGNYRLLLFSRDEEKSNRLAEEIRQIKQEAEVEISCCQHEACWEADIIIPAVPYNQQAEVAERIRDVATQKIVVSLVNPGNNEKSSDLSAAEELQKLLPHSKLVKAFNTNYASAIRKKESGTIVFLAGDDKEALREVSDLIRSAGFQPLYAGPLTTSKLLEDLAVSLRKLDHQRGDNQKIAFILTS